MVHDHSLSRAQSTRPGTGSTGPRAVQTRAASCAGLNFYPIRSSQGYNSSSSERWWTGTTGSSAFLVGHPALPHVTRSGSPCAIDLHWRGQGLRPHPARARSGRRRDDRVRCISSVDGRRPSAGSRPHQRERGHVARDDRQREVRVPGPVRGDGFECRRLRSERDIHDRLRERLKRRTREGAPRPPEE